MNENEWRSLIGKQVMLLRHTAITEEVIAEGVLARVVQEDVGFTLYLKSEHIGNGFMLYATEGDFIGRVRVDWWLTAEEA